MCFPIPTQHEACGVFPWVMLRYQLSARTATFEPKPSPINTGSFVEHGTIRKCRSSPCLSVPGNKHGSLNVPIEHHPTIRYMVYNGYYKVMSNIPKMGQLPTPDKNRPSHDATMVRVMNSSRVEHHPASCSNIWVSRNDIGCFYDSETTKM